MKVGIMQPYFLPYIGYWQLMNYVDIYVIYDDVQFIKGGWVNRNRILSNNVVQFINLPLIGKSPNKLINEIQVNEDAIQINKIIKTVEFSYKKSLNFDIAFEIFKTIMMLEENNLALFLKKHIEIITNYLGINTKLILSSEINKNNLYKGDDRVIDICKILGADTYINAIGGRDLYSKEKFLSNKIDLYFLNTKEIIYKQCSTEFQSNLSILDVMMNCNIKDIVTFLNLFELV